MIYLIQLNDGRLVSGCDDHTIKFWNITTNQCITTITKLDNCVSCLIQLQDERIAFGIVDNTILLWQKQMINILNLSQDIIKVFIA